MKYVGNFFVSMLLVVILTLLGGFIFMKLWEWFIVYAFDVQPLTFLESIGVSFFISFLRFKPRKEKEENGFEKFLYQSLDSIVSGLLILGIGWILTLFQ